MANEYGTYHLADNPTLYEPTRTNNFELLVTGIDSLLKMGVDASVADAENSFIKNGQEVIRVSVVSSTVPNFELSTIEVSRGNNKVKFAGTPTFGDQTITLNDYIGARTKEVLLAWQNLAYDIRSEKVGRAANYKKDCILVEYSPDYEEVIRTWTLKGCWISSVTGDTLSSESNDKQTITATLVYDSFRIND